MKKFWNRLKEFYGKHKLACSFAIIVIAGAVIYGVWGSEIDLRKATELWCKIVHCTVETTEEVVETVATQG